MRHILDSFKFRHNGNTLRMRCVTVVDAWGVCVPRERCLGLRYRGMRRNTNSCTGREIEPLLDQLVATCTLVLRRTAGLESPLCCTGSHILHHLVFSLNLRATRAPCRSRAGLPSNLGVAVSADASTFEYERHRACLSVKTSTDEPSHVPLHARTLRCRALSVRAACRGFRGLMEAPNWY